MRALPVSTPVEKESPVNLTPVAAFTRTRMAAASRRGVLAGLTGGLLATGFIIRDEDDAEARKQHKRRKRGKNTKDKNKPKIRVDATCSTSGGVGSSSSDGNVRFAQTFSALASGPLVKAELLVEKQAGSTGDFILRLGPVDGSGFPTNEVLAVSVAADASVPDGVSTVTFTFANPASVVAGVEYALILTRPGGDFIGALGQLGNSCAGQRFFSPDQKQPFQLDSSGFDLEFTTFVRS
jgi:hypothetical protein